MLAWLHINNGKIPNILSKPQILKLGYISFQEGLSLHVIYVTMYICVHLRLRLHIFSKNVKQLQQ